MKAIIKVVLIEINEKKKEKNKEINFNDVKKNKELKKKFIKVIKLKLEEKKINKNEYVNIKLKLMK